MLITSARNPQSLGTSKVLEEANLVADIGSHNGDLQTSCSQLNHKQLSQDNANVCQRYVFDIECLFHIEFINIDRSVHSNTRQTSQKHTSDLVL